MTQDEQSKELIMQNVYATRGRIIQLTIQIETSIDIYISNHFTTDEEKNTELICLILAPRVNFEGKVQVFSYLVDKYHPEFKKEHKGYLKELIDIGEKRNIYAHYPIELSTQSIADFRNDGSFTFVKLKNQSLKGTSDKVLADWILVNQKEFDEHRDLLIKYNTILNNLIV
jgi:hypothetical protein